MKNEIIEKLKCITLEEKEILNSGAEIDRKLYMQIRTLFSSNADL